MRIPQKLPYIWLDNVNEITVTIRTDEIEDGHQVEKMIYSGPCNLSQTEKRIQNKDGIWIPIAGVIHIKGDIAPDYISYDCLVNVSGSEYTATAKKLRNPDGSINHTEIYLLGG